MKKVINSPGISIVIALVIFNSCRSSDKKQPQPNSDPRVIENKAFDKDTLPNKPQFKFTVDDTFYKIDSANINVYYSSSDATIRIDAGADETGRLSIVIDNLRNLPGFRGNGWKGANMIQPGADTVSSQPTVTFYKNLGIVSSWNNLDNGFNPTAPNQDGSLYIYEIQRMGERKFLIKGRIQTRVLKNKYESSAGEFNRDHDISGSFVVPFEDYWLKL